MGILSADLDRVFRVHRKEKTAESPKEKISPLSVLKIALERYAGATAALTKEASEGEYRTLYTIHGAVEASYDECARIGKRPDADAILDKFAGWSYLKGRPKREGDWTALPDPESLDDLGKSGGGKGA